MRSSAPEIHVDRIAHTSPSGATPYRGGPTPPKQRFATLRWKTVLIVTATLVGLLTIVYLALRIFLLGSFSSLEWQTIQTDLERVGNAITDDLTELDILTASYAVWDDTYTFVVDHNPTYIEKNTYDQFLRDSRLNLFLIVDTSGQVVFGKAFDLDTQQEVPLPDRFLRMTNHDVLLAHLTTTNSITGVVLLANAPMLIASHAIVTSEGAGPIRGTLLMGRYLDARQLARLAKQTHLTIAIDHFDSPNLPAEVAAARADIVNGTHTFILPLSPRTIAGYAPLTDLDATAKLLLRVESSRSIYAQGEIGIQSFLVSLGIAGLLFSGMMLVLLDRYILARLARLQQAVQHIGRHSDLSKRITLGGADELAQLTDSINGMLAALEQAQIEQQQAEEVQRQLLIQQEALRTKREFLSVVSHELRTPLMPMLGYLDLMIMGEGGDLSDDQRMFLTAIRSGALRMSGLVEDLLEIVRLEANTIELHFAAVDLRDLIAETIRLVQPELDHKKMLLVQEIAAPLPLVEIDAKRIGQVLLNLVSNAIKYSYDGGRVTIRAFQSDGQCIEAQVEDTGVGLTTEQQRQLFTRFYRADNPLRNQVSGTGLGLWIAKSFIEIHGGTIAVRSQPGAGSVFTITLPLRRVPASVAESPLDGYTKEQ
jgi:signal transduction histidine kinase